MDLRLFCALIPSFLAAFRNVAGISDLAELLDRWAVWIDFGIDSKTIFSLNFLGGIRRPHTPIPGWPIGLLQISYSVVPAEAKRKAGILFKPAKLHLTKQDPGSSPGRRHYLRSFIGV